MNGQSPLRAGRTFRSNLVLGALFALAFGSVLVFKGRDGGASSVPRHLDSNVVAHVAAEAPAEPKPATPTVISATAGAIVGSDTADNEPELTPSPETDLSLRESLRLAASDENPDIAERAKDAYDDLMRDED